jgi:hypothetical protein
MADGWNPNMPQGQMEAYKKLEAKSKRGSMDDYRCQKKDRAGSSGDAWQMPKVTKNLQQVNAPPLATPLWAGPYTSQAGFNCSWGTADQAAARSLSEEPKDPEGLERAIRLSLQEESARGRQRQEEEDEQMALDEQLHAEEEALEAKKVECRLLAEEVSLGKVRRELGITIKTDEQRAHERMEERRRVCERAERARLEQQARELHEEDVEALEEEEFAFMMAKACQAPKEERQASKRAEKARLNEKNQEALDEQLAREMLLAMHLEEESRQATLADRRLQEASDEAWARRLVAQEERDAALARQYGNQ